MNEKLVKMVLLELENGKRKRWEVTNRLRNYSREDKVAAIKHCVSGNLVELSEEKVEGPGRNPVYVSITEKGKKELARLKETVADFGIWSV